LQPTSLPDNTFCLMKDFAAGEIIAIDKPYQMSSFGALARVRGTLTRRMGHRVKIGHAGTLDPLATGVLILLTGKFTKRIEEFQQHTKEYTATLQLGSTTASFDLEHPIDATFPTEHINEDMVRDTLKKFQGEITQVPPSYSACKIGGDRAYKLMRKGDEPQLAAKAIHIDSIELTRFDKETMQMDIRVVCGKGTYIRSLARDIGKELASGAHLTALRRTRVGDITQDKCIQLEAFPEWLDNALAN